MSPLRLDRPGIPWAWLLLATRYRPLPRSKCWGYRADLATLSYWFTSKNQELNTKSPHLHREVQRPQIEERRTQRRQADYRHHRRDSARDSSARPLTSLCPIALAASQSKARIESCTLTANSFGGMSWMASHARCLTLQTFAMQSTTAHCATSTALLRATRSQVRRFRSDRVLDRYSP
jgi:hypothetical protein